MDAHAHLRFPWAAWLLAAALLALIPLLALLQPGMPNTADGYVHLLRALETAELLRGGVLYPRWAPDFYLGYGYPFFNFYAPGAHLLAAGFALAGLGVLRGLIAVQALALLLYPTGAFLAAAGLLRGRGPHAAVAAASLAAAAAYLYAPLRLRELFTQGNVSQLLALGWLPWAAWALIEMLRRGSWRWAAAAGLALAGLVYTHHPSAFLAFPTLGAFGLCLAAGTGGGRAAVRRGVLRLAAAFALALALSAAFWLPAVLEMRHVGISGIEAGMFNARQNLVPLHELLAPAVRLDAAALNPPQPISLGALQAALAAAGLLAALVRGRRAARPDWPLLAAGLLLLACLALILPASGPLWARLPLARLIAFPWRLLGPALLFAALLAGSAFLALPARWQPAALLALLVAAPLSVAPYLFPRPFAAVAEPGLADIIRYEQAGGARATASANEYLPAWVRDPDPPAALAGAYLAGEAPARLDAAALPPGSTASLLAARPLTDAYRLALPDAAAVRFLRFYFPGWRAWVDGEPAAIIPDPQYGLIQVPVPAGVHEVELRFGPTPPRTAGWLLAAAGLAAAAALLIGAGRASPARAGQRAQPRAAARLAWAATAAILAVTAAKVLVIEPATGWFRLRSPVEAPAGMQHALHARFTNGIELLGYDIQPGPVRQGDAAWVRLYWRTLQPLDRDFRPFLHLGTASGDVTWANQTKLHAGDKPARDWPVGFYVVDAYLLETPEDAPAVLATLRAGWLDPEGRRVPSSAGPDTVAVGTIRVVERRPLRPAAVPGGPAYQVGPAIRLLGHTAALSGDRLAVALYWQASAAVAEDYTVFVHVLDAGGVRVAQGDGPPLQGWYPTSAWAPGQVIVDERTILLPADAQAAMYTLAVGLYRLSDGARLPVTTAAGARADADQILFPVPSR